MEVHKIQRELDPRTREGYQSLGRVPKVRIWSTFSFHAFCELLDETFLIKQEWAPPVKSNQTAPEEEDRSQTRLRVLKKIAKPKSSCMHITKSVLI
jgi:hypothetical protein